MIASLDTNVIIHLYTANNQSLLFTRFERIQVNEFIRSQELKNHADENVLAMFDGDVQNNKIDIVTDIFLKNIGMYNLFIQYVNETRRLFEPGDLGEVYAIALARTLGCVTIVTDDIKERGPHYTLMRIPDSEVMPFAFFELLFLDYLENRKTEEEVLSVFNEINFMSDLKMNCISKLKFFIRRFWTDPFNDCEKIWMRSFCNDKKINAKERMEKLSHFLAERSK